MGAIYRGGVAYGGSIPSSNPNLLDNPWFTVNQRGITSWVTADGSGYKVDRFICDAGNGSISNGVFVNDAPSYQKFEDSRIESLLGKVVTLSALNSDGTIASTTFTMPSSLPSSFTQYGAGIVVMMLKSGNESQVCRIPSGYPVKAVKLELGSVSTLALDTAPNYATELLKCQRYFQEYDFAQYGTIAQFVSSNDYTIIHMPVPEMRVVPAVNITRGIQYIASGNESVGANYNATSRVIGGYALSGPRITTGSPSSGYVYASDLDGCTVTLSADL